MKSALTFSEGKKLESLSTSQLTISGNKINNIPLEKLLVASQTRDVSGVKSIQSLTVNELTIDESIQGVPKSILKQTEEAKLNASQVIEFEGDINMKHLKTKAISGVNLTAFLSDVLLKGENELILNGDLISESLMNVGDLKAKFISRLPISNFMTVNGDQTIVANVFINKLYTSSLSSPIINGEQISSATVATTTSPNIISPKTRFMDISITRNLNIEVVQDFMESLKRQVIGTKVSDLIQIYHGRVIIQGSLRLQEVQFTSLNSNVFVGNMKIFQNLLDNYWMKSARQNILAPNFVINNEVSAGSVIAAKLINHPVEKFLLINMERPQGTVLLRFEDVVVKGDVKGHKSNEPSKIFLLSSTVVPRSSSVPIEIMGNLEFRNELVVKRLRAGKIF